MILGVASVWERRGLDIFVQLASMLDDCWRIALVSLKPAQAETMTETVIAIARTDNQTELAEIYTAADAIFEALMSMTV